MVQIKFGNPSNKNLVLYTSSVVCLLTGHHQEVHSFHSWYAIQQQLMLSRPGGVAILVRCLISQSDCMDCLPGPKRTIKAVVQEKLRSPKVPVAPGCFQSTALTIVDYQRRVVFTEIISVTMYYFYIVSNYRRRKTETSCQENLFTFFKYHVDSVQMSQHYYWTQLENHLCLRMSSMGQWNELDEDFYSYGES